MYDFVLYVPFNSFQVCLDRSSWVEPVLSKDNAVTPVRFEPATPYSEVKHSTTTVPFGI